MFRLSALLFSLLLLIACNPFTDNGGDNQFSVKKRNLYFMGHDLGNWSEKQLPYCKQCSFNIHTKKMLPRAMLFKQVNNARGDLVFLSTTNIRYNFALQTGGRSYSIAVMLKEDKVQLTAEGQEALILLVNKKQEIRLGLINYFIKVQKINHENEAVDIIIWPENRPI